VGRDGAVMTYRNLLVPRSRPESMAAWIKPDRRLAAELHAMDRSFIYKTYVVEKIAKGQVRCPTESRRLQTAAA
jgi:S-adenosylmethionine-diacylglycerol 3-amino-3-carboxypropyl transferase